MALKIRALTSDDIDYVKAIHERDFPDLDFALIPPLLASFIVEDENDEIILAGGIQATAEAIIVTNKTKNKFQLVKALRVAHEMCLVTCKMYNAQELLAFTNDVNYANHLIRHGFEPRAELALRMKL